MKRTKFLTALTVSAVLLTMMSACRSTGVIHEPGPKPSPGISPSSTQSVDFIDAVSQRTLEYTLKAIGQFSRVVLHLTNKSETALKVNVEVGTEFDPADSDLQLVVFNKAEVVVQPHARSMVELEATSLDIHNLPTVNVGTAWQIHKSARLAEFLRCAADTLEKKKQSSELHARFFRGMDHFVLRDSVWRARGATRDDFIDFDVNRVRSSRSNAELTFAAFNPVLEEIIRNCRPLKSL
jgi:hypothetical protein